MRVMKTTFIIQPIEDEYVVEAMLRNGTTKAIGKVYTTEDTISVDVLEQIFDLANWGCNGAEPNVIGDDNVYNGMECYCSRRAVYIPIYKEIDHVNANIIIRKHYDIEKCWYLRTQYMHREQKQDCWCYRERQDALTELRNNPLIVSQR